MPQSKRLDISNFIKKVAFAAPVALICAVGCGGSPGGGSGSGSLAIPTATAQSSPPHPLASKNSYGPGVNGQALYNVVIGGGNRREVDYRFAAQHTGSVTALRQYFVSRNLCTLQQQCDCGLAQNHCYGRGAGATIQIQIQTDDGTPNHFASGAEIGHLSSYTVGFCPPRCDSHNDVLPLLALERAASVTAGSIYHIVYTSLEAAPDLNFSSLDGLYSSPSLDPAQPTFSKTDLGLLFRDSGGVWKEINGPTWPSSTTPIIDIEYADGFDQGLGYIGSHRNMPEFISGVAGGFLGVRETFTVSGASRIATSVFVRATRINAGSDPLIVTLEDVSSGVIEQGTIASTTFPENTPCIPQAPSSRNDDCALTWGTYTFKSPKTLQTGHTYQLKLTCNSSTTYATFPLVNGMRAGGHYGFGSGSVFAENGKTEYTIAGDSGWTGWPDLSQTPSDGTAADLQFYFTLQ